MNLSRAIFLAAVMMLPTSAFAADFQAVTEPPAWSWTGFYGGVGGGWGFGTGDYDIAEAPGFGVNHDLSGPLAGGQVGYGAQLGWMYLGAEAQGLWSGIDGDKTFYDGVLDTHTDVDWLAMGKLRAGAAFDRFLVFGTGGYAGAEISPSASLRYCSEEGNCSSRWSDSEWANGYFFGLGGAVSLSDNWSVGLEWNHVVFNDVDFGGKVEHGRYDKMPLDVKGDFDLDLILATANFRF